MRTDLYLPFLAAALLAPVISDGATDQSVVPHYYGPYSNYANSPLTVPNAVVSITGGGGAGATAEATVNPATGGVAAITVTAPGAGNANLRAQEGVFTRLVPAQQGADPLPRMSVDGYVKDMAVGNVFETLLHRFTLPLEHARFLLYLLECEGVSASSVRPGYERVAREVKELIWQPEEETAEKV